MWHYNCSMVFVPWEPLLGNMRFTALIFVTFVCSLMDTEAHDATRRLFNNQGNCNSIIWVLREKLNNTTAARIATVHYKLLCAITPHLMVLLYWEVIWRDIRWCFTSILYIPEWSQMVNYSCISDPGLNKCLYFY